MALLHPSGLSLTCHCGSSTMKLLRAGPGCLFSLTYFRLFPETGIHYETEIHVSWQHWESTMQVGRADFIDMEATPLDLAAPSGSAGWLALVSPHWVYSCMPGTQGGYWKGWNWGRKIMRRLVLFCPPYPSPKCWCGKCLTMRRIIVNVVTWDCSQKTDI